MRMKSKKILVIAVVVILIASLSLYWNFGNKDDVKIVDLFLPDELGMNNFDQLHIILQNNESIPVNVGIEVKNAYVNEMILPTSGVKISGQEPLKEEITLLPGKNTIIAFLAYKGSGTQNVEVEVIQKRQLVDESSFNVEVPPSMISLQMEYEKETTTDFDLYKINGYLTKEGSNKARDVVTIITIIDDKTGEIKSTHTDTRDAVTPEQKTSLSTWKGRPAAYIELARNQPSNETYMPIESVAKGKVGDRYRVNIAAIWKARVVYAELVIPPA